MIHHAVGISFRPSINVALRSDSCSSRFSKSMVACINQQDNELPLRSRFTEYPASANPNKSSPA